MQAIIPEDQSTVRIKISHKQNGVTNPSYTVRVVPFLKRCSWKYSHSQRSISSERLPRYREDSWKHLIILDTMFFLSGRKMSVRRKFDFQDSSIQKSLKKKKGEREPVSV